MNVLHTWRNHQPCPTCKGHGELWYPSKYIFIDMVPGLCYSCAGVGLMLWMMPQSNPSKNSDWMKCH